MYKQVNFLPTYPSLPKICAGPNDFWTINGDPQEPLALYHVIDKKEHTHLRLWIKFAAYLFGRPE